MRVIFMGTPDFSVEALTQIAKAHDIVAVYAQPPRPAGRGYAEKPSPVHQAALDHGWPVFTPKSLKSADAQAAFGAHGADIAVVAAYGLILPQAILDAPKRGCINIHASLLPRWRGAAPIQRAIMAGDSQSGVTIMQMDAGLDTGPMLLSRAVPISDATTAGDLHDTLADLGARLVLDALNGLAGGTVTATPQPADGVTYAAKIDKAEAHIDFNRPAREVLRHIHGLSPFPGAWCTAGTERLKLLHVALTDGDGVPGTVLDDKITIACGSGAVRVLTLQRAGRGAVGAADFVRGFQLPAGTVLA